MSRRPSLKGLGWVFGAFAAGTLTIWGLTSLEIVPLWPFLVVSIVAMALASGARPANISNYAPKQIDDRGDFP